MRHWLRYRKGKYYIKSGAKSNIQTSALLQGLQVITSVKSKNQTLATKFLVLKAYHHFLTIQKSISCQQTTKVQKQGSSGS